MDDFLSAVDTAAMRDHLQACASCARHDVAVRRGLMLARNLPTLEPSPDFMERLHKRIDALDREGRTRIPRAQPPLASFGALAAAVALVAYLAVRTMSVASQPIRMAPVVASAPATPISPAENPAFVASSATGMSVWPAVLMLDDGPQHLADVELQTAVLRR